MRPSRGRQIPNRPTDGTRTNEMIRVPEVRLIGADGSQLGIMETRKAMILAREQALDLVEVSPTAKPPVCRITDYGKFRFEQSKKAKVAKSKQHVIKVKEIKFHPKTAQNDYNYRVKRAKEFLESGFKVRMLVQFRGREMAHQDYGKRLLEQAKIDLVDFSELEMDFRQEGNSLTLIFAPLKQVLAAIRRGDKPKPEDSDDSDDSDVSVDIEDIDNENDITEEEDPNA